MSETIIVALMSLLGSLGGTVVDNQIKSISIDTSVTFYANIAYIAFSGYGSGADAKVYID